MKKQLEMKKNYIAPLTDVVTFNQDDLIRTSGENEVGVQWAEEWGIAPKSINGD